MRTRTARLGWSVLLLAAVACDGGTPTEPPASDPALAIHGTPGKTTDQIEIRLDVQPDDGLDIGLTFTGDKKTNLKLDDDADPLLPNFKLMPSLKPGAYSIAMNPLPAGYALVNIACVSIPNGGTGVNNNITNNGTRTVQVQLEALERVVCTFVVARHGPLTVTINRASWQGDPAYGVSEVAFEVVFSYPVTDFDGGDVTVGGVGSGAWVSPLDGTGTWYQVTVSAWEDGVVSAGIPAAVVTDGFGQSNAASTSTDDTVEVYMGLLTECHPSGDEDPNVPICSN